MNKIVKEAYGKINLSLDVLRKREDGYHEVSMIMQQIDLKDIITITEANESRAIIESNNPHIPRDASNLVHKAWEAISRKYGINRGVHINIQKGIPMAAGLAGGSSDAAAVLEGLNELWELGITKDGLMDLGVTIGADVPFCIMGGTALAEGIGERLTPLKTFSHKYILLAKPDVEVSTALVYKSLDLGHVKHHPNTDEMIRAIEVRDIHLITKNMVNVLENVTIKMHPIIEKIKNQMTSFGATGSLMSGSGPTVFGIFDNEDKLLKCKLEMDKWLKEVYFVKTV